MTAMANVITYAIGVLRFDYVKKRICLWIFASNYFSWVYLLLTLPIFGSQSWIGPCVAADACRSSRVLYCCLFWIMESSTRRRVSIVSRHYLWDLANTPVRQYPWLIFGSISSAWVANKTDLKLKTKSKQTLLQRGFTNDWNETETWNCWMACEKISRRHGLVNYWNHFMLCCKEKARIGAHRRRRLLL